MEVIAIGLICAAVFGAVVAFSAFLRHLLLSRDKQLNDDAQHRALSQEAEELKNLRFEMQNRKRMTAHYQLLTENKHAIQHLDDKIDELTQKKAELITRWAEITIDASRQMIDNGSDQQQKYKFDKVKQGIDHALMNYDQEINQLQQRRETLLNTHHEIGVYLLEQDKRANENLDALYDKHSLMLEKMFIRHNENSEHVATKSIDAGTNTFAMIMKAPIQFLMSYFKAGTGFNLDKLKEELKNREDVADEEDKINQNGDNSSDIDDEMDDDPLDDMDSDDWDDSADKKNVAVH
ncbi:hypothetical protein [Legionella sp. W05-934-2]|jgi:hypothetical protein|uniref:hypothetical protein n=1 Tax=Legionella sp. W05-934-2 TaxID=1198649 RepID=UPI0034637503